ncbi:LacI family DNA-binding transcriptional regulator [Ruminococcus albus]|jgi:LacI family sucrose operon transcriptional repressor|uniref:LacI family DNA-binding transcriptional regulator n=1 Tax=Ruminococcus albus TaxID=1264 RepID=UPI000467DC51|nr:LacI family DNA-binding transcriptional regulator [Ruminococcus albus]MBE6867624.1 LacI family transcriptional regulator [Ruminococcus albus]MBP5268832.1 LacI family DNA-binding transcriptional regulator [Ruminococcus sp.]
MNISEFAKEAGVSVSAVSRYFNDGYLSDDKRALIEAAIERTGYVPSYSARTVRSKVTKLVGVILPKLSSESIARITEGIGEVLGEEGFELLLVNTSNDYNREISSLELFRQNRVDGVILLAGVITDLHRSLLAKMRVPTIIVGQKLKGFNCVCHNDLGAAYNMTKLMLDKGAKRPAFIGANPEDMAAGKDRRIGFEKAVLDAGLTLDPKFCEIARFSMDSGYEKAKHLFSGREKPDCLFCATDNIAAGAMLYCRENGIRIPEDLMIGAVGDSRFDKVLYVSLSSVHLHYKTAGREGANMLLAEMKKTSEVHRIVQLEYDIIERESTNRIG